VPAHGHGTGRHAAPRQTAPLRAAQPEFSARSALAWHREQVRILVVDDDRHVAYAVKRGLEGEGFAVDVALDGTDGLWLATENAYDALVLDVMLPGLDGFQLCTRLRDAGDWTPILMLTAKDGERDEANALDTGADDFLSKPFSFVVLVARLHALLRRGRQERPAILRAGDLRLDPGAHQVWRGDDPIDLTPRQFSLLEFLMRNVGDTHSKAEILGHVWDFAFDGDPNIVEVYIRQLRLRIDEPFGRASLQTVRGVGYRLDRDGG
jgi:two-component system OmpR family response regulator